MDTYEIAKQDLPFTNSIDYIVDRMYKIQINEVDLKFITDKYVYFITYYMFFGKVKCATNIRKVISYDEKFIYLSEGDIVDRKNNPTSLFIPMSVSADNILKSALNPGDLLDCTEKLKYDYNMFIQLKENKNNEKSIQLLK